MTTSKIIVSIVVLIILIQSSMLLVNQILAQSCGVTQYIDEGIPSGGGDDDDDAPTYGDPDGNIKRVEVSLANQDSYQHSLTYNLGPKIDIEVTATNKGDQAISGAEIEYYLSDNLTFNEAMDIRLGQDTGVNIPAGGSITKHLQDVKLGQPGTYYIFCKIEASGDGNSANNFSRPDDVEEYAKVVVLDVADLLLKNQTISSGAHVFEADNAITAQDGFTVTGNADVTFSVPGGRVVLKPGFKVTEGATFSATVE